MKQIRLHIPMVMAALLVFAAAALCGCATTVVPPSTSTTAAANASAWNLVPLTVNYLNDEVPDIDGDLVVWRASDGHDTEIMLRDLAGGAVRRLTDNIVPDNWPRVSGRHVVWESGVSGDLSLHLLDLDTGAERTLSPLLDYAGFDLWGGLVVWIGGTLQSPQVFVHTIASGGTQRVDGLDYPGFAVRTDGRHVGILGLRGGNDGSSTLDVLLYDPTTDTLAHVAGPVRTETDPRYNGLRWMNEGRLVWSQSDGHDEEIYLHDVATGKTRRLTDDQENDYDPEIGGDRVLWHVSAVRPPATTVTGPGRGTTSGPGPTLAVGIAGEPRRVVVNELGSGTSRDLGDGYGRVQADGGLAAVVSESTAFTRITLHDLETGDASSFDLSSATGQLVELSGGRAVWWQRPTGIGADTAEVMVATRTSLPPAVPPTPPGVAFGDVYTSPYRSAIEELGRWGIARGAAPALAGEASSDPARFRPERTMLRGELAVMLRLAAGLSLDEPPKVSPFRDIGGADDEIGQAVNALYAAGVVQVADFYDPGQPVTRQQLVSMVVRAALVVAPGSLAEPPADYAYSLSVEAGPHAQALRVAEYNHVLDSLGGSGPDWDPALAATRGEAAQLVAWLLRAALSAREGS